MTNRVYIDDKGYGYLKKITELYAFVSSDKNGEGIVGQSMMTPSGMMMMPFVCADKARMESLKPLAKQIAEESKKKIKLIRLIQREELETYE